LGVFGGRTDGTEGVEGLEELLFDGGPGVFAGDEVATAFPEFGAGVGMIEEEEELGFEIGVVAEPEAGAGGAALVDEDAALGVDEAGSAGEEGLEKDDAEAFVDGGVDEGEGAGHGVVFFLFADESGVEEVGRRAGGRQWRRTR
jgi:hypothetical protein